MKPVDLILIAVLAVIMFFCLKSTAKHFRGEGSCCGGGGENLEARINVKDKDVSHYPYTCVIDVKGMKCDGCAAKVENALNRKNGIYAIVDLDGKNVTVHQKNKYEEGDLVSAINSCGSYKAGTVTWK